MAIEASEFEHIPRIFPADAVVTVRPAAVAGVGLSFAPAGEPESTQGWWWPELTRGLQGQQAEDF